ncbi:hypothetical protein ElyMa_002570000, partial [Elysia marginata]
MFFVTTFFAVLFTSQLMVVATNVKDICQHADDDTSNPILLDADTKTCVERDVYTPPEMNCQFSSATLKAFYTGHTNATLSNSAPKIEIVGTDAIVGSAKAVFFKPNAQVVTSDVIQCNVITYKPQEGNNFLPFDNATECRLWFKSPDTAACETLRRFRDEMNDNNNNNNYALPDDCRLKLDNDTMIMTTLHDTNKGNDPSKVYLHADFYLFENATFFLHSRFRQPIMRVEGDHDTVLNDENHFESGYFLTNQGIFVFKPFNYNKALWCEQTVEREIDLNIVEYIENDTTTMYHFSPKTPLVDGQYEFNISKSDLHASKTVESDDQCHSSDAGYRIINLKNGNTVTVMVTKTPMMKTEVTTCHVRSGNWYFRLDTTRPYAIKVVYIPHRLMDKYDRDKKHLTSNNVYCLSYPDTVEIWMRPDATTTKIRYITDNGVAFLNTYNPRDFDGALYSDGRHCFIRGAADRCKWLNKDCKTDKFCLLDDDQPVCK